MFAMKAAVNGKLSAGSLLAAWAVYEVAIVLGLWVRWGLNGAMEAIWNVPRFRSALGWYVFAQALVIVSGTVLMRLVSAKASLGLRRVLVGLFHLGLAIVSAGLWVVCEGAIWKMTGP